MGLVLQPSSPGTQRKPILGPKKPQTKKKAPDRTVYFKDGRLNPVIVLFEVGVSQRDVDLKPDALNYLLSESNRGRQQLVVLCYGLSPSMNTFCHPSFCPYIPPSPLYLISL